MTARIALIAFVSFLAYLVYSANSGSFPEVFSFYKKIPYGDKVGHFCLMGTFAFLAVLATRARSIRIAGFRVPIGAAAVFIIVFLEEFSQLLISRRSFSLTDLSADALGISILGWIATLLFRLPDSSKRNQTVCQNSMLLSQEMTPIEPALLEAAIEIIGEDGISEEEIEERVLALVKDAIPAEIYRSEVPLLQRLLW